MQTYTMMETCREVDMSYDTLKFYCNEGLIPYVKRDKNNRRYFDEQDVAWIKSLGCLKQCGMSLAEMRDYIDLVLQGNDTIPERKEILKEKRKALEEQMAEIQKSIAYIDWKQNLYDDMLKGGEKTKD